MGGRSMSILKKIPPLPVQRASDYRWTGSCELAHGRQDRVSENVRRLKGPRRAVPNGFRSDEDGERDCLTQDRNREGTLCQTWGPCQGWRQVMPGKLTMDPNEDLLRPVIG